MAQRKIHIVWQDGRTIDIRLESNPAADYYYLCVKHLQHVNLQFDQRGNPFYIDHLDKQTVIENLIKESIKVGLDIKVNQLKDQDYLNALHSQYFEKAQDITVDNAWFIIHDNIHLIELLNNNAPKQFNIWFDFMEKAGPLVKKFDRTWLKYATTSITKGMCSIREHELGKNLSLYRQHNESLTADIICQQSPPWVWLKPILDIAICDYDNYKNFDSEEFNKWFAPAKDAWCAYWKLIDWQPKEIFSAIPIGYIEEIDQIIDCFRRLDYPQRLTL